MPDSLSDVQADFRDVYKQPITDEVVIKFYNRDLESVKLRFDPKFVGAPITFKDVPAFPNGRYRLIIEPTTYRLKEFFYNVESGKTNALLQYFFVDPDHAHPRLIDFGDLPAKSYSTELLRILGNSGIDEAAWTGLEKKIRATILNLSAKMSIEGITDGTKLMRLVNSIDRTWLDVKRRERIFAHVDANLYQALRDYPERLTDRLLQWADVAPERTLVARRERGSGPWQRVSYAQAADPNSFKTLHDKAGNIQLTFARGGGGDLLADIDLDDHKGLDHVADVLKHKFSGKDTDPYDIHEILRYFQGLDPEYALL